MAALTTKGLQNYEPSYQAYRTVSDSHFMFDVSKPDYNDSLNILSALKAGDSGSLVLDARTLIIYGHVVGSNPLGEVYVSPYRAIFDQIRRRFPQSRITISDLEFRLPDIPEGLESDSSDSSDVELGTTNENPLERSAAGPSTSRIPQPPSSGPDESFKFAPLSVRNIWSGNASLSSDVSSYAPTVFSRASIASSGQSIIPDDLRARASDLREARRGKRKDPGATSG